MSKKSLDKNTQENLEILFALMTHGGRSDRVIAKTLGISNTTMSRRKRKLEKEGYIKEYTMIPDFCKMGIEYIALSFATSTEKITQKNFEEVRELSKRHPEILCNLQDQDARGTNWFSVSLHKNYESYVDMINKVKEEFPSYPKIKMHSFVFRTCIEYPKPFSLRNLNSVLIPPEKKLPQRNKKNP